MTGFTKLFSSIVHSTVWREDMHIKVVWVTMLALADRDGNVSASIPGLADAARVTVEQCQEALDKFMSPDPFSRTKDNEGRRIKEIDGGWFLLNYQKYRELRSAEEARLKNAERQRKFRERKEAMEKLLREAGITASNNSNALSHIVAPRNPIAEAEAVRDESPQAAPLVTKKKASKPKDGPTVNDILGDEKDNYWAMTKLWSGNQMLHKAQAECYVKARTEFSAQHIAAALEAEAKARGKFQGRLLDWLQNEAYRAYEHEQETLWIPMEAE